MDVKIHNEADRRSLGGRGRRFHTATTLCSRSEGRRLSASLATPHLLHAHPTTVGRTPPPSGSPCAGLRAPRGVFCGAAAAPLLASNDAGLPRAWWLRGWPCSSLPRREGLAESDSHHPCHLAFFSGGFSAQPLLSPQPPRGQLPFGSYELWPRSNVQLPIQGEFLPGGVRSGQTDTLRLLGRNGSNLWRLEWPE